LYINGVLVASGTVTGTFVGATGNASIGGEVAAGETANRFRGDLDEIRATNNVKSAGWILTEYNNQNSPATFYTISPEDLAGNVCIFPLPVTLLEFRAELVSERSAKLSWITLSETNNDYFTIEKSLNGTDWQELTKLEGAGNSSVKNTYEHFDDQLSLGITYYRLKQTDFNGEFSYSKIVQVNPEFSDSQIQIYPNPAKGIVTISGSSDELEQIEVYDALGKKVF